MRHTGPWQVIFFQSFHFGWITFFCRFCPECGAPLAQSGAPPQQSISQPAPPPQQKTSFQSAPSSTQQQSSYPGLKSTPKPQTSGSGKISFSFHLVWTFQYKGTICNNCEKPIVGQVVYEGFIQITNLWTTLQMISLKRYIDGTPFCKKCSQEMNEAINRALSGAPSPWGGPAFVDVR